MSVQTLRRLLIRILESLGLVALLLTEEVHPTYLFGFLALTISLGSLEWIRKRDQKSFSSTLIFLAYAVTFIAASLAFLKLRPHPLLLGAYLAPLFQLINGLAFPTLRNWTWRLGLAFVAVVLAIAISPEFSLAVVLFIFLTISSAALSCLFLESELERNHFPVAGFKLPRSFMKMSVGISALTFLVSLLIFPILPRHHLKMGQGWDGIQQGQVGYTEQVNLDEMMKLAGTGEGEIVLRIFLPEGSHFEDPRAWLPLGLLKGRTLDVFNGSEWLPKENQPRTRKRINHWGSQIGFRKKHGLEYWTAEYIRESNLNATLPTPYGTRSLRPLWSNGQAFQFPGQEWVLPSYAVSELRESIRYHVEQSSLEANSESFEASHLAIPPAWSAGVAPMKELSQRLLGSLKSPREKIKKIKDYFATGKFKGTLDFQIPKNPSQSPAQRALTQLKYFLFESHQGHCQLFSSSAAILLRLSGVPTRLVAGFRAVRPISQSTITVRQGDAHAWIETWDSERGWQPMDPTPLEPYSGHLIADALASVKEFFSTSWYRYVVSYTGQTFELNKDKLDSAKNQFREVASSTQSIQNFIKNHLGTFFGVVAFFLVAFAFYTWAKKKFYLQIEHSVRYESPNLHVSLLRRRKRIEAWKKRQARKKSVDEIPAPLLEEWQHIDDHLRFGKDLPASSEWTSRMQKMDSFLDKIGA